MPDATTSGGSRPGPRDLSTVPDGVGLRGWLLRQNVSKPLTRYNCSVTLRITAARKRRRFRRTRSCHNSCRCPASRDSPLHFGLQLPLARWKPGPTQRRGDRDRSQITCGLHSGKAQQPGWMPLVKSSLSHPSTSCSSRERWFTRCRRSSKAPCCPPRTTRHAATAATWSWSRPPTGRSRRTSGQTRLSDPTRALPPCGLASCSGATLVAA